MKRRSASTPKADFPQDWAMTQNNLGLVHKNSGDLASARTAFSNAARGFTAVGDADGARDAEAAAAALDEPAES